MGDLPFVLELVLQAQKSMAMVRSCTSTVIPRPGPARRPKMRW